MQTVLHENENNTRKQAVKNFVCTWSTAGHCSVFNNYNKIFELPA